MLKVCQEEQSSSARPEIKDPLTDVSKYETILIGTPIWYGHIRYDSIRKIKFKWENYLSI